MSNKLFPKLIITCLCLFLISMFLYRVVNLCFYPYPLENGEGICAHMTQLLKMGDLYKDLSSFPLLVANYPPIYFLLCGLFDFSNPFIIGRLISVCSVLCIVLILYRFMRKCCKDGLSSMFSVSALFILPWVSVAGILYRVDMLAVCLSFAGFYFITSQSKHRFILSTIFFLSALYTKHSAVVGPVAGYVYLFLHEKNKIQILKSLLIFLLSGMMIFVICVFLTGGEFFNHLIRYNIYDFTFDRFFMYFGVFVQKIGFIWLVFLPVFFSRERFIKFCKSPISIYFFIGLLSLLFTGRDGASEHYLYEAGIGVVMVLGFVASDIMKRKNIVLIIFLLIMMIQILLNKELFRAFNISKNKYLIDEAVVNKIKNIKTPVLAEDVGRVLVAGKTIYVHTFAVSKLIERGMLDPSFLYKHIQKGFFEQVILNSKFSKMKKSTLERFTREMLIFIHRKYVFDRQLGSQYFYRYDER